MTQEIIELIQAEIDGQNTPEASQRLTELCQTDETVRQEFNSAQAVGRALDHLSDARLPDGFAGRVMASLPENPSWARHRAPARPARSRSMLRLPSRPLINLAYGLVVGVFVTVATMSVLDTEPVAIEGASGTMLAEDGHDVVRDIVPLGTSDEVRIETTTGSDIISVRIEGVIPDGTIPSIVFQTADGERVSVPLIRP